MPETHRTKTYFASDFHFGVPDYESSLQRERKLVDWLEQISVDAKELYLVGDLFDFWFEYKHAIPKYYTRFLGQLARMSDADIKIYIFSGNHDVWMRDYFSKEFNIEVHHAPLIKTIGNKKFYIAHGDGLGPGDHGYKFIKKLFRNSFCQWLFRQVHPDIGIRLANYFSKSSRSVNADRDKVFLGEEKEWLIIYSKELLQQTHYDYMIYGHRHYPLQLDLGNGATYINLGDWITHFTYAVFDGEHLNLKKI